MKSWSAPRKARGGALALRRLPDRPSQPEAQQLPPVGNVEAGGLQAPRQAGLHEELGMLYHKALFILTGNNFLDAGEQHITGRDHRGDPRAQVVDGPPLPCSSRRVGVLPPRLL